MSNEFKIGLTVIIAFVAVYLGLRFLMDEPIFQTTQEVVTTFERVDGLATGNIVYMNGVRIGAVRSINFTDDNLVRVGMGIDHGVQIPVDSKARLSSVNILEGKAILIERGTSDEILADGGYIEGIYVDTFLETLGDMGDELGDDISASVNELNVFLAQLNRAFDDERRESIGESILNVESATSAVSRLLAERERELDQAILSASRILAQLDTMATDNRAEVDSLMANLNESSKDLRKVSRELDQTVNHLNDMLLKINEGDGTLGKLMNDPSLYNNADSLSVELRNLIKGINDNPGRYLRHMNLIDVF